MRGRNIRVVVWATHLQTDILALAVHLDACPDVELLIVAADTAAFRREPIARALQLRARLLEECGLAPDATLLLGAGRLASEKRWPMVIDAVMAAGIDHPIGFVLAGDGRDRAAVVSRAGQDPHIRLLAPIADRPAMARLMASADALVHGCDSETYCMVASEARASGLPLIVPDSGGAGEQVALGAGSTYRAGDPGDLAQVLTELIGSDLRGPRSRAVALAGGVRSMDEHFAELFDTYRQRVRRGPSEPDGRGDVTAVRGPPRRLCPHMIGAVPWRPTAD